MWKPVHLALLLTLSCWPILPASAQEDGRLPCNEIEVYTQAGCPHCGQALAFLDELGNRHPQIEIRHYELTASWEARERFLVLAESHGLERLAVPTFLVCGTVMVGFDTPAGAGSQLRRLLGLDPHTGTASDQRSVELPLLGRVSVADLGLPLFTLVVGLVDGFNPCAMWVLLFLLSLLVHVRNRLRIVLIAGTFVVVSGLVYLAFMAAWLHAFLIVGLSRTLQIALGVTALAIGAIHMKDFVAMGTGPSLSIPESAKPGIYSRIRRVVQAENLPLAMIGVTVLAVIVNLVELLCTAGLPALYTQILVSQGLSTTTYYGYLLLYSLAYVLDDAIIVAIAVYTLSQRKIQEKQGRWLKLISAIVIIALGLVLLVSPQSLTLTF